VPRELACFKFRPAGRHTIDADALSSKLQRSRLGKADDSELAGSINRRARKAEVACEGGVLTMAGPLGSPQESGDTMAVILQTCSGSGEICGTPGPELIEQLKGSPVQVDKLFQPN
jgi:hypothetical protein